MAKGQSETLQSNEHVGIFYYLINFGLFVLALFPTRYRCLADVRKLEVETNKRLTYLGSWKFLKNHKSNMNFSFRYKLSSLALFQQGFFNWTGQEPMNNLTLSMY